MYFSVEIICKTVSVFSIIFIQRPIMCQVSLIRLSGLADHWKDSLLRKPPTIMDKIDYTEKKKIIPANEME